MTKYIRNENGGITAVTDEHFDHYLHETTNAGNTYMLPGYEEITEAEARKLHPQLFGKPDPQVTYSDFELKRELDRARMFEELHGQRQIVTEV